MQCAGKRQNEFRDRRFETLAILRHTEITPMHRALRGRKHSAARVFELLAGAQQRLMPDHTEATHFFSPVVRVDDYPVTRNQLRGNLPGVAYGNGIGKHEIGAFRIGLVCQVLGPDRDRELIGSHVFPCRFAAETTQAFIAHQIRLACKTPRCSK